MRGVYNEKFYRLEHLGGVYNERTNYRLEPLGDIRNSPPRSHVRARSPLHFNKPFPPITIYHITTQSKWTTDLPHHKTLRPPTEYNNSPKAQPPRHFRAHKNKQGSNRKEKPIVVSFTC
ncbi:hypothetical protein Peur_000531 [Populus x canadensis]